MSCVGGPRKALITVSKPCCVRSLKFNCQFKANLPGAWLRPTVGNRRFRTIVASALDEYNDASSKWAKSMVATKIVGAIHADGGRFLKQRKGNDEAWYELTTQEAKAKVSHAIRDAIAAKDKTKASKSGPTSIVKIATGDPPPAERSRKELPQHRGSLSSVGSISDICMMPPQNLSTPSNFSLTSLTPMGGQQPFGGGSTNLLEQDQIQGPQDVVSQRLQCGLTPTHPFAQGMQGTGLPQNQGKQITPQQVHYQKQLQQLRQQQHHLQQQLHLQQQQILAQQQQQPPQLEALHLPQFRAPPEDLFEGETPAAAGPSVARARRGLSRRSSSSDTDDGDGDFLSLIDTVLGPMGPKGPQGKEG
jgi:hypothetical protein